MIAVLDHDGRLRTVNKAWSAAAEHHRLHETCTGIGWNYLSACDALADSTPEAATIARAIRTVLDGHSFSRTEYCWHCPGEEMRWYSLSVTAIREAGFDGAITTHFDITERRRAETMALASERLAVAGRMAASVAHEVNNPLAGIRNAFALLKGAIDPNHPHVGFAPLIEMEIDRISRIVRQMLDMHRPDREVPRRLRLGDAVKEVAMLMAVKARARGIALRTESPPDGCVVTITDAAVRQVLYNLIQNAIDASVHGEEVVATVERMNQDRVAIAVRDRGAGIDPSTLERIFEPYFTTKMGGTGTGLGLAVCRGLIEAMGGSIHVETCVGQGSTFRMILPASEGG